MFYCSEYVVNLQLSTSELFLLKFRECQRANWKQHKLMCGKPLVYDTVVKLATSPTTSNDASDVLSPADGFKPPLEVFPIDH